MVKVSEVTKQSLSTLVADFYVCQSCGVVDRDRGRLEVGYPCPNCGQENEGGLSYFGLPIHALINLIQESFHQKPTQSNPVLTSGSAHKLAVVDLFLHASGGSSRALFGRVDGSSPASDERPKSHSG